MGRSDWEILYDNVTHLLYNVIHTPLFSMQTTDVILSVRISPRIKTAAERQAKRDELSLSDVTRMLLKAYAKGEISVKVG